MGSKERAPSAYFAFCDERRSAVQQDLLSKQTDGAKVSVAKVAKILGEAWRELDESEKQKYKELAVEKAEAKAKQHTAEGKRESDGPQDADGAPPKQVQRKTKRGPTAYFVFMNANRSEVQKELSAAAEEGKSVSVATVAKALGERWRSLTDEEKAKYSEIAEAKTKELQESAYGEDTGEDNQLRVAAAKTAGPALPLSLVKRIMSADDEFGRITGDGLKHVAFATELFLGLIAQRAAKQAATGKRSTIKFSDVLDASRAEKRMRPFTELLGKDVAFADIRDGAASKATGPKAKVVADGGELAADKGKAPDENNARRITDFFKA